MGGLVTSSPQPLRRNKTRNELAYDWSEVRLRIARPRGTAGRLAGRRVIRLSESVHYRAKACQWSVSKSQPTAEVDEVENRRPASGEVSTRSRHRTRSACGAGWSRAVNRHYSLGCFDVRKSPLSGRSPGFQLCARSLPPCGARDGFASREPGRAYEPEKP